jgi:hypothetical protein
MPAETTVNTIGNRYIYEQIYMCSTQTYLTVDHCTSKSHDGSRGAGH